MRKQIHILIIFLLGVSGFSPVLGASLQHQVQKGETLWGLARKYEVPLKSILQANSLQPTEHLQIGQKLLIPGKSPGGVWYQVKQGDTLSGIASIHNLKWRELQQINSISSPHLLQIGSRIFIPNGSSLGFGKPLRIPLRVTSRYGYRVHPVTGLHRMHEGIDFRAAIGTRVYAAQTGRVIYTGRKGGYGKMVGIQHQGDFTTWYGHLSQIRVSIGEYVHLGKVIGLSGNTGISTGPHLHFEIRYKGRSENPAPYLTHR